MFTSKNGGFLHTVFLLLRLILLYDVFSVSEHSACFQFTIIMNKTWYVCTVDRNV